MIGPVKGGGSDKRLPEGDGTKILISNISKRKIFDSIGQEGRRRVVEEGGDDVV
jgi:hypothetical protein